MTFNWRAYFWLLLSMVLLPAIATAGVGVLILAFYREAWDVAFGVLVLCFAFFSILGTVITVFLLRRTARLAQLQTDFVANISHDFRTPLTSIRLFVDTLLQGRVTDPAEQRRCLELLGQEAERMEVLVNRVLTWRSQERTGGGYRLAPREPRELLEQALAPFRVDPRLTGRLEVLAEPKLPRIMADAGAVVEALRNLVENAFKYSGEGLVVVTLRSDGEGVAVSVRDHGAPIPRQEQQRIFERFYRVANNDKPGTGLGLAIASHVARAHGGAITLRSSGPAGNVFTLHLPLTVPEGEEAPGPQEDGAAPRDEVPAEERT